MRISKLHLVVCVAALCGSLATLRADDNPDQAAARAALEAKLRALGTQPASTSIQNSGPAMSEEPAQQVKPPVEGTPSGAAMQQSATSSAATMPAEKPPMTSAPAAAPASSGHGLFAPVPPPSGSAPMGVTSQSASSSTNTLTVSPAFVSPAFSRPPRSANANNPGGELGLKPIQAPPLPISSEQQAQLQALLEKYDANAVTPEQYQAEREKILAEHK